MINEFSHVFAFIILGLIFVAGGILTSKLLRPNRPNELKLSTYECGEDPIGNSWLKFNPRFYVVALIFVIFDVEIVFLFPWALVYKEMGQIAFFEMLMFVGILILGYAYAWRKGDLDWVRPRPYVAKLHTMVSHDKPRLIPIVSQDIAAGGQPA